LIPDPATCTSHIFLVHVPLLRMDSVAR